MAKLAINTDTNRKEIEITRNGETVGSIFFSPSDMSIVKRLHESQTKLKDINVEINADTDIDTALAEADRIDAELRAIVDYAFDYPCSDIVFGGGYCFTPCNGVSAIEQFLTAAVDIISAAVSYEADASKARQEKYLAKYKK